MSRDREEPKGRRGRPAVVVEEVDGPPIDLQAWVDRYIAHVLELEGVQQRVAAPRAVSVG